mgnify:CR=1 FL=1|jgi:large subunit ribosomal protein L13
MLGHFSGEQPQQVMRPTTSHLTAQIHTAAWHIADAEGLTLGHLARDIAMVLMGKHRPTVSEHVDTGDSVVVINAEKIRVSGNKASEKFYVHHTGYPGGRRETPYADVMERKPDQIIFKAVQRMLPKNKLGRTMLKKLHVYAGSEHPHTAQQPQPFKLYA